MAPRTLKRSEVENVVGQFLQINGPWAFAGACLAMLFWLFVRERKSVETSMALLGAALDRLTQALAQHDARVAGIEQRMTEMDKTLDRCEAELRKRTAR